MSKNKLLFNSIISIIIVFLCLFIFINKLNGEIIISDLLINIYDGWLYLMLASILLIFSVYLRALRWNYLFQSNRLISISDLFSAQLVGYFINNISPVRIGDFAKSYLIAKKTDKKNSYILGSIIMERALDTIMLIIFMFVVIWYYGSEYLNINFSLIPLYIFIPFILFSILLVYYSRFLIPHSIKNVLNEIWQGFTAIDFSKKSLVIFSSFTIWSIYWVNVFLIQSVFSLNLNFLDCLFILICASVVQMIPTGFGALGIFHLGVESALVTLEVNNYHHFLILLWLYSYFIYSLLGSYCVIHEGKFTLKKLYYDLTKNY